MADGSLYEGLVSIVFDDGDAVAKARQVITALDQEMKKAGSGGSASSMLGNLGGATGDINQIIERFGQLRTSIEQVASTGTALGAGMAKGLAEPLAALKAFEDQLRRVQQMQAITNRQALAVRPTPPTRVLEGVVHDPDSSLAPRSAQLLEQQRIERERYQPLSRYVYGSGPKLTDAEVALEKEAHNRRARDSAADPTRPMFDDPRVYNPNPAYQRYELETPRAEANARYLRQQEAARVPGIIGTDADYGRVAQEAVAAEQAARTIRAIGPAPAAAVPPPSNAAADLAAQVAKAEALVAEEAARARAAAAAPPPSFRDPATGRFAARPPTVVPEEAPAYVHSDEVEKVNAKQRITQLENEARVAQAKLSEASRGHTFLPDVEAVERRIAGVQPAAPDPLIPQKIAVLKAREEMDKAVQGGKSTIEATKAYEAALGRLSAANDGLNSAQTRLTAQIDRETARREANAFKPNVPAVEAKIKQVLPSENDPVGAANIALARARENVAKVTATGASTQVEADDLLFHAREREIRASNQLTRAKEGAAAQTEKDNAKAQAQAAAAESRAAVAADPKGAAYAGTDTRESLNALGGVNASSSYRSQILQIEGMQLNAKKEQLAASYAEGLAEKEAAVNVAARAQIDKRLLANANNQANQAARDEFGGGAGRTGFLNGLSGGFGGAGGEGSGVGGLLFQAGQAAKFYALYTALSAITGLFGSLKTEAEKYTISVNDLSIAMNVGKEDARNYAIAYAQVGATYAASPIESIQGATKFVRSFRTDDPSGVNAGYTKEQIGSFGASSTSVVQQLEGKDQVTKVTQDLVAITRAYGVGAAGVSSIYDQMTQIAQHYGFSTGGQIISGVAQIGDLARSSGYDAPGAAALIASVQQATGVGSDQAAGDVKRFLGSQKTLDKVFESNKIGGDKPFNERLDALITKMSTMTEVDRGNTLNSLGNPRIQAVVGALVSGKQDQDAATKAAADPTQTAGIAAAQATKRITESFGGAMDKLLTQLDQFKISIINSGLIDAAGVLVTALGGVLDALTAFISLLHLFPSWVGEALTALLAMVAAEKALGALRTALRGSGAASTLRTAFNSTLGVIPGGGANVAANAEVTAAGVTARNAEAAAARAATAAGYALTAANGRQAQSAALTTAVENAQAEVTSTAAAAAEAATVSTAAQAKANEAQAAAAAIGAEETDLLAQATATTTAANNAALVAKEKEVAAANEAAAAVERLNLAQASQAEGATAAATANEGLTVTEGAVTETAVAASAALTAEAIAEQLAAAEAWNLAAALKGMGVSMAGTLIPLLGMAAGLALIAGAALAYQAAQKEAEIKGNITAIEPPLAESQKTGNAKALASNIAALDEQRKQQDTNNASLGHGMAGAFYDWIHGKQDDGKGGQTTSNDRDIAEAERLWEESQAAKKALAVLLKKGGNLNADSDLKEYFGAGLTIPDQGIDQLVGNRAGVGTTTSVVSRFIAQAPADSVGKLLNSGDTSVSDSAALFNYLNQAAGKSTNPGTRQVDTEKIRQLAIQMRDRLAARGASLAQLAQANEIVDAETKAAFDILLKNTAAQVDKIKNAKGPTGVSDPASLAQIKAIVTEALTKTTLAGDVDSTVALLAGVDQAFLVSYKEGLKAKIAILASEAASLQAALTAAKAAQALVSGYGDSMRHFGDEVVGHGNNLSGAGAAASNAQGVNTSAQSKLAQQLKTLDESLKYASPSGSDFKFPGDKTAPTAAQVEEARIASTEIPGDPLSAATTSLALAKYKMSQAKDQVEYYQALKALHDAQYAYGKAVLDQANNVDISGIDITDPLAQARQKVRQAQAQLSFDSNRGAGSDVIQTDKNAVRQAQSDASKAAFDQQFSDQQTNYDLNRISLSSYLSYLNSQHDYLTAVRVKTRAQVDELNQVDRALKGLTEGLQGQFNLGDIKVPTPYEVRRALVAGASSSSTVQNITIAVNGGDLTAVRGVLAEYVGQAAMQTTGAGVRKIA